MSQEPLLGNSEQTTQVRKADHIRICLEEDVQSRRVETGLEQYRFRHCCLPEINFQDVDLSTTFLGKPLQAPILISSMTGGTEQAKHINLQLAEIAQCYKLAMGVGSQRVVVEKPELRPTFAVRSIAPDIPLFANIGAVQFNYGYGLEACRQLVDMLAADALILHLNPLQECIQHNGDTNFSSLLPAIESLCQSLGVPVIAKEVGNGISASMAAKLINAGVTAIDVAGAGGTSWAKVEAMRNSNPLLYRLGMSFADWGIPTADCLTEIQAAYPKVPLIASGGLKNGIDVAKCLALGASLGGLARPFLQAACDSPKALQDQVELILAEIKTVLFCTGVQRVTDLSSANVLQKI